MEAYACPTASGSRFACNTTRKYGQSHLVLLLRLAAMYTFGNYLDFCRVSQKISLCVRPALAMHPAVSPRTSKAGGLLFDRAAKGSCCQLRQ